MGRSCVKSTCTFRLFPNATHHNGITSCRECLVLGCCSCCLIPGASAGELGTQAGLVVAVSGQLRVHIGKATHEQRRALREDARRVRFHQTIAAAPLRVHHVADADGLHVVVLRGQGRSDADTLGGED